MREHPGREIIRIVPIQLMFTDPEMLEFRWGLELASELALTTGERHSRKIYFSLAELVLRGSGSRFQHTVSVWFQSAVGCAAGVKNPK